MLLTLIFMNWAKWLVDIRASRLAWHFDTCILTLWRRMMSRLLLLLKLFSKAMKFLLGELELFHHRLKDGNNLIQNQNNLRLSLLGVTVT